MGFRAEFKFEIGDKVKTLSRGEKGFVVMAAISGESGDDPEIPVYFIRDEVGGDECRWRSEDNLVLVKEVDDSGITQRRSL